ncbi:MAG: hypothetical protein Q9169_002601 [Polycauliona sp. 2 TL-2023]
MADFNAAAEREAARKQVAEKEVVEKVATEDEATVECSICYDTRGQDLAFVVLPGCKHRFHELCINAWLNPIQVPNTTRSSVTFSSGLVDPVFRELETRCHFWEVMTRDEPVGMLFSGDEIDSDVEEASAEAYDQDEEIMADGQEVRTQESGTGAPSDRAMLSPQDSLEEDLEEGEIQEEQPFIRAFSNLYEEVLASNAHLPVVIPRRRSQCLPDISEAYIYDISPFQPREVGYSCPTCRRSVFREGLVVCHADTLQLIRVRLRLTDLAYRCLDIDPTNEEQKDRATIIKWLDRRHADNVTLGEREVPLTPASCRRVFRQARSILRKEAYGYAMGHHLEPDSEESSRIMEFGTFFEDFRLRDEDTPFFFDANPAFNEFVRSKDFRLMQYQKRSLKCLFENYDPRPRFFHSLRLGLAITPHSYVRLPPASDDEMKNQGEDSDLSMSDD